MIRKRVYLNKPQAEGLIQIFRRNQLLDLLVYVAIYTKNKSKKSFKSFVKVIIRYYQKFSAPPLVIANYKKSFGLI